MGKIRQEIDDALAAWIAEQHVFFVATAPSSTAGRVNLSPKGVEGLRVLEGGEVAWLDLTGSGAETLAHVRENGRVTLMFCAFEGPPRIVRLYGRGTVVEPGDPEFPDLRARFSSTALVRSILRVRVDRVADSCGYGVPLMRFEAHRTQLTDWVERKGQEGLRRYQREKNEKSIDGLPALRFPPLAGGS